MFRRVTGVALLMLIAMGGHAFADFAAWGSSVENDPFSGDTKVTVDFLSSMNSGVLMICNTQRTGILVRTFSGLHFSDVPKGATTVLEFAIDGDRLLFQRGETIPIGNNFATAQVRLTRENSKALVSAFTKATRQIAIKDGISDGPFLLGTSGSLKAGSMLNECLNKQAR
jgi:hypothetical protein